MNADLLRAYGQALQLTPRERGVPSLNKRSGTAPPAFYPINQGGLGAFPYRWEIPTGFNDYTYLFFDNGFTLDTNSGVLSTKGGYHDQYLSVLKAIDFKLSSADNLKLNQAYTLQAAAINTVVAQYKAAFGPVSATDFRQAGQVLGYPIVSDYDYLVLYVIAYQWSGAQANGTAPIAIKSWANTLDPFSNLQAVPSEQLATCRAIVMNVVTLLLGDDDLLSLMNLRGQSVAALKVAIQSIQKPSVQNGALQVINNGGRKTWLPGWTISPSVRQLEQNLKNSSATFQLQLTVELDGVGAFTVSINNGGKIRTQTDPLFLSTEDGQQFKPLSFTGAGSVYLSTKVFKGRTKVNISPNTASEAQLTGWAVDDIIRQAIANGPRDVTGYYFTYNPNIDFSNRGTLGQLTQLEICQFPTVDIYYKEGDINSFLKSFPIAQKWDLNWLGLPNASNNTYAYSATVEAANSGFTVHLHPDPALQNTGSLRDMAYVMTGAVKWMQ